MRRSFKYFELASIESKLNIQVLIDELLFFFSFSFFLLFVGGKGRG